MGEVLSVAPTLLIGFAIFVLVNKTSPIDKHKEYKLYSSIYTLFSLGIMAYLFFFGFASLLFDIRFNITSFLINISSNYLHIAIAVLVVIAFSAPIAWLVRGREVEAQNNFKEHIFHFLSNGAGCAIAIVSIVLLGRLPILEMVAGNQLLAVYESVVLSSALFLMFKAEIGVTQQIKANRENALAPCFNAIWCFIAYLIFSLAFIHSLAYLLVSRTFIWELAALFGISVVYLVIFSYSAISTTQKMLLPTFFLGALIGISFFMGVLYSFTPEISILSDYIELIMIGLILVMVLVFYLFKNKMKDIRIISCWSGTVILIFIYNFLLSAAVFRNIL